MLIKWGEEYPEVIPRPFLGTMVARTPKDRNSCDLIVIGASSDGVEALRTLASHLPKETGASENELLEEAEKARAMLAKYAICFARQK